MEVRGPRNVCVAAAKKYSSSHAGPNAAPGAVAPSPRRSTSRPVPLVTKAGGGIVAVGEGVFVGEGVGLGEPVRVSEGVGETLGVTLGVRELLGVTLGVGETLGVALGVGELLGAAPGEGELDGEVMTVHWMVT